MTNKEFQALFSLILPELPGFRSKGHLLYAYPMGDILRGLCGNPSGFDKDAFRVHVIAIPLFVPTDHIHFGFGFELKDDRGCEAWWDKNDRNAPADVLSRIKTQAVSYISRVKDVKTFAET